jgi:hypothetical protein
VLSGDCACTPTPPVPLSQGFQCAPPLVLPCIEAPSGCRPFESRLVSPPRFLSRIKFVRGEGVLLLPTGSPSDHYFYAALCYSMSGKTG